MLTFFFIFIFLFQVLFLDHVLVGLLSKFSWLSFTERKWFATARISREVAREFFKKPAKIEVFLSLFPYLSSFTLLWLPQKPFLPLVLIDAISLFIVGLGGAIDKAGARFRIGSSIGIRERAWQKPIKGGKVVVKR